MNTSEGAARAGKAFTEQLKNNPRTDLEQNRARFEALARLVAEADAEDKSLITGCGLPWPEDVDGWKRLALTVGLPMQEWREGKFTIGEIKELCLAWLDAEKARLHIASTRAEQQPPAPAPAPAKKQRGLYSPQEKAAILDAWHRAKHVGILQANFVATYAKQIGRSIPYAKALLNSSLTDQRRKPKTTKRK